jgi:NAD(P)-dependent dehydrogenase (short-subunit alcohol dehydrogenase family)
MSYRGRAAIVTGGAAGIGLAIARRLAAEGVRIAVWDKTGAAEAARSLGAAHVGCAVDVSDEAAVAQATDATWHAFGRVDLLVNNAGILGPVAPLWEQAPSDFRRVLDVNLVGTYLVCRAVVPRLRQQSGPNRGRIVNISSIQAKEGLAMSSAYAASKSGIIALTKTLGKELAREGILVNCITPAAAATAMMEQIDAPRRADILARIPMGRFVEPEEIAAMTAWLGSDECSFSTGAVFDLSGGRATY